MFECLKRSLLWQMKPAIEQVACKNLVISPLFWALCHTLFLRILRTFLSVLQHNYQHIGLWQIVSSFQCWFTVGFVWQTESLPVADWGAISLLAPAPFLLWLLGPQSPRGSFSALAVTPPIWVQSSGRGEGRMERWRGWKDRGIEGVLCSTEAFSQTITLCKCSHSENRKVEY